MTRLVTVQQAEANLLYQGADVPDDLPDIVDDASAIVMNYLNASWSRVRQFSGDASDEEIAAYQAAFGSWTDSSGDPLTDSTGDPATDSSGASVIPGSVRRATLLVIGALDAHREGDVDPITPAVVSLLVRYRGPTVL